MAYVLKRFPLKSVSPLLISAESVSVRTKTAKAKPAWKKGRKPLALGRAPSKDYDYFKKNNPTDKDLIRAEGVYRTYNHLLKSLACCFQQELVKEDNSQQERDEIEWDEKSHHQLCMATNNAENARLREKHMARVKSLLLKPKVEEVSFEDASTQISQLEKESEEWLNSENMLSKIEEAVDNPVNYNFAVNKDGIIASRIAQTI